jgi:hypothetical protein
MKGIFLGVVLSCLSTTSAMESVNLQKHEKTEDYFICCVYEQIDSLYKKICEVQEENLRLTERLERYKDSFVNMPDFSRQIFKDYGVQYIAEEDGWLLLSACPGSCGDGAYLNINGIEVLRISTGCSCISCAQITPVKAGDRYSFRSTVKVGSYGACFFPGR